MPVLSAQTFPGPPTSKDSHLGSQWKQDPVRLSYMVFYYEKLQLNLSGVNNSEPIS